MEKCPVCKIYLVKGVNLTKDHIVPQSSGWKSKTIHMCNFCNNLKSDMEMEDFQKTSIYKFYKNRFNGMMPWNS